ncbi:MAG: pyrroline-5-carboxylate reductase [Oscillospiraceae bacterium]|jgi:pyrroline-5-carboxylate reductase|nr:pyrroline-5-carboxylate reductase [Oscillospiraceae bacterium]
MKTLGFIGVGNMGATVARAAIKGVGASSVMIFDLDGAKTAELASEFGCRVAGGARELAAKADFVFLCVKPKQIASVLEDLSPVLSVANMAGKRQVIVSIAAGVSIDDIALELDKADLRLPIIRLLPNTPLYVDSGLTAISCSPGVSDEDRETLSAALGQSCELLPLQESLIDAASPVFSSGPAFVYMFAEALADGAVKAGLPRELARSLAANTLRGAAEMLLQSGKHPGQLKDEVCSPGGSTIVGVEQLEKRGFRVAVISAVWETYLKTTQLA